MLSIQTGTARLLVVRIVTSTKLWFHTLTYNLKKTFRLHGCSSMYCKGFPIMITEIRFSMTAAEIRMNLSDGLGLYCLLDYWHRPWDFRKLHKKKSSALGGEFTSPLQGIASYLQIVHVQSPSWHLLFLLEPHLVHIQCAPKEIGYNWSVALTIVDFLKSMG